MSVEEMKRGIRTAYADGAYTGAGQDARLVEFDRMIAAVVSEAEARALEAAARAAQGAAPQAESAPKSSYISPHLPAQIRGLYRADLREKSIQTMLDLAGDLIQELIDLKAAPVLPLSGVDEDALAEYTRVKQAEAWERNSEETEVGGSCSCCGITEVHRPQNPYRKGESDDQPA